MKKQIIYLFAALTFCTAATSCTGSGNKNENESSGLDTMSGKSDSTASADPDSMYTDTTVSGKTEN